MPKRPDYADNLRDALLALALVPIAGLHTASYWLTESLERTSRLATDVIATTTLARSALPGDSTETSRATDPTGDVLAQDLLEAVRTYVRSMVRLPADAGIHFTGELEERLRALLEQIQPDAATDPERYLDGELERLLRELDRLSLIARADAGRAARSSRVPGETPREGSLANAIDDLRTRTQQVRAGIRRPPPEVVSLSAAADERPRGLRFHKARARLEEALREAQAFLANDDEALRGIRMVIERLQRLAKREMASKLPAVDRPDEGGYANAQEREES